MTSSGHRHTPNRHTYPPTPTHTDTHAHYMKHKAHTQTYRAAIEKQYGEALMKLAQSIQHKDTTGDLRQSWDALLYGVCFGWERGGARPG